MNSPHLPLVWPVGLLALLPSFCREALPLACQQLQIYIFKAQQLPVESIIFFLSVCIQIPGKD